MDWQWCSILWRAIGGDVTWQWHWNKANVATTYTAGWTRVLKILLSSSWDACATTCFEQHREQNLHLNKVCNCRSPSWFCNCNHLQTYAGWHDIHHLLFLCKCQIPWNIYTHETVNFFLRFVMPINLLIKKQKGIFYVIHPWCSWISHDLMCSQLWIVMRSSWICQHVVWLTGSRILDGTATSVFIWKW